MRKFLPGLFICLLQMAALGISAIQIEPEEDPRAIKSASTEPQLENEWVRVWKTSIPMEEPIKMQNHEHPRIIVALNGGVLNRVEQNGSISDHRLEQGQAYWLSSDPPGHLHAEINPSIDPLELMVIELKTLPKK